ncbi:MAG: ATP-binding cassette domain-containing protein [Oscillospiraceae bacterium]
MARLKERGHTIVIAEHRLYYLADLFDRMLIMENGEIVHEYTKAEKDKLDSKTLQMYGLRSLALPVLAGAQARARVGDNARASAEKIYVAKGSKEILQDLNINLYAGEIVAITGSNGAGKTTLCRILTGADKENSGIVKYNNIALKPKKRIRQAFFVQQDADYQLYADTVFKELMLGILNTEENRILAEEFLKEMNLENFRNRHPGSLSGGQKQRVLLAAAALRPGSVIVLDEPTSGLDGRHMKKTASFLQKLAAKGTCVVLITHDMELIENCVDRIVYINKGKVNFSYTVKKEPS